jgi:hypothetical protein
MAPPRAITVGITAPQLALTLGAVAAAQTTLPEMLARGHGGLLVTTAVSAVDPVPSAQTSRSPGAESAATSARCTMTLRQTGSLQAWCSSTRATGPSRPKRPWTRPPRQCRL